MLMNEKEVNHLLLSGEQFDKSYDGLIGKYMKIKNYDHPDYTEIPVKSDYCGADVTDKNFSIDGKTSFLPYPHYAVYEEYQIVKILCWRYINPSFSKSWPGLWLGGKIYVGGISDTDMKDVILWVRVSDVEILENGGVNSPSYLLIIYNMKEVVPSC